MKNKMSYALCALLAVGLLVLAGCQTDQPGVTNRAGTIKATLAAGPSAVTEAAVNVLEDMDLIIINQAATAIDGRVVARTAQDVKVRVDSEKIGQGVSEVYIRVGKLGDADLSMTILNEVKEQLGIEVEVEVEEEVEEAVEEAGDETK